MISDDKVFQAAMALFLLKHGDDEVDPTPDWSLNLREKAWVKCISIARVFHLHFEYPEAK